MKNVIYLTILMVLSLFLSSCSMEQPNAETDSLLSLNETGNDSQERDDSLNVEPVPASSGDSLNEDTEAASPGYSLNEDTEPASPGYSLNGEPVAVSPDGKWTAVTITARIWIDTNLVNVQTGDVMKTGIFTFITDNAWRYDYQLGKNERPDPYVEWLEWSPDSKKVLLSYSFFDDLYTRQTGVAVFNLDSGAVEWIKKLLPAEGEHSPVEKPDGFSWDSTGYGWSTGLVTLETENREGIFNRAETEEAVKAYAEAVNTGNIRDFSRFVDSYITDTFGDKALETAINAYQAYFRQRAIVRVEFAGIYPFSDQTAVYWLFNGDGRVKEVYFKWDREKGYLTWDNFVTYSHPAKLFMDAFTQALIEKDAQKLVSILTPDDILFPVEKVPDIFKAYGEVFDLKKLSWEFTGNTVGEAGTGALIYRVLGEKDGNSVEHEVKILYGDGLLGIMDEFVP